MQHEPPGFPVALGVGHPVVAGHVLARIVAFAMAEDHHHAVIEARQSAHDGRVVGVQTVTGELDELAADGAHEVVRVGAFGMPGHLDRLPGG